MNKNENRKPNFLIIKAINIFILLKLIAYDYLCYLIYLNEFFKIKLNEVISVKNSFK